MKRNVGALIVVLTIVILGAISFSSVSSVSTFTGGTCNPVPGTGVVKLDSFQFLDAGGDTWTVTWGTECFIKTSTLPTTVTVSLAVKLTCSGPSCPSATTLVTITGEPGPGCTNKSGGACTFLVTPVVTGYPSPVHVSLGGLSSTQGLIAVWGGGTLTLQVRLDKWPTKGRTVTAGLGEITITGIPGVSSPVGPLDFSVVFFNTGK